jgi:hypothetical protein
MWTSFDVECSLGGEKSRRPSPLQLPLALTHCRHVSLGGPRGYYAMLLDQLRAMAEAVPAGGAVTLPRDWLLAQLSTSGDTATTPPAVDLTVEALVSLFGKRPSTVRSWLEEGRFPGAWKLRGRQWRVPHSAVVAFQEAERQGGDIQGRDAPTQPVGSLGDYRSVRRTA